MSNNYGHPPKHSHINQKLAVKLDALLDGQRQVLLDIHRRCVEELGLADALKQTAMSPGADDDGDYAVIEAFLAQRIFERLAEWDRQSYRLLIASLIAYTKCLDGAHHAPEKTH